MGSLLKLVTDKHNECIGQSLIYTVEPCYFELAGESKTCSKWQEFEIADSK